MGRLSQFLPGPAWPITMRYLAAIAIMVVATAIQLGLNQQSGLDGVFLLPPAVFVAGVLFDGAACLLAAFFAIAVGAFWIFPRTTPEFLLAATLFSMTALGAAGVAQALRRRIAMVVTAERAKNALLRELAHRTKNNL